jgi:hypothetical protein
LPLRALEPFVQRGKHAARPVLGATHLLDVDAAVLDYEVAAHGHEAREPAQGRERRLVAVRGVLDDRAATAGREKTLDLIRQGGVPHDVALDDLDRVRIVGVGLLQRGQRPVQAMVDRDDQRFGDAPVGLERAQPVPEPEPAATVVGPDLDHDVRARGPLQVLVHAQVLWELRDPHSRVEVPDVLVEPLEQELAHGAVEPHLHGRRELLLGHRSSAMRPSARRNVT